MAEKQAIELPPLEDRPLVTFALFAYNQEQYIREAVEGAFAQTYEPLEIILSDDCSTDQTFEIMEKMAMTYEGPHKVLIRKSSINRGLGCHIHDVSKLVNGDYVIIASGDDVSLPHRTTALIKIMQREKSKLASSNYNRISTCGAIQKRNVINNYENNYLWKIIKADADFFVLGSTAAYKKDFFVSALESTNKTLEKGYLFNEDDLFSAFAVATNERPSTHNSSALVNYRDNAASLSSQMRETKTPKEEELKILTERFRSQTRAALLEAICEMAYTYPSLNKKLNKEKIIKDLHLSKIEILTSDPSIGKRLYALLKIKSIHDFKIWLIRIFGTKFHARIRWYMKIFLYKFK